jgi:DHA1 family tetracycline resistance protein-like MFS transporter
MAVGLCLALVGVCSALVQGGLIRVVSKRVSEATMLTTGLFFGALGFLAYGLATETWQFWLGVPLMALWGLAGPATQGLMTRCVSPGEQGLLQGAQSSVRGMTGLIGPLLFTQVYALFIGDLGGLGLPGAPFLLAGALTLAAMALAFAVTRRTRIEATLAAPAP